MTILRNQQLALVEPALRVQQASATPVHIHTQKGALDHLGKAFIEGLPLAVLLGEGKSDTSYLIDRFLAAIKDDVAVVRITKPCPDAVTGMREVIHAIGFESTDMCLTDLENVFAMFLAHQRNHGHRTIICMEESQDFGRWLLDTARRLVELEAVGKYGLMVILSGRPSLNELLDEHLLNTKGAQADERIALAPFTLAETRGYLRWRIESEGTANIADVFEFDAITLIHELSNGVADAVSELCSRCLRMAAEENIAPVTPNLVEKARKLLRLPSVTLQSDTETAPSKVNGVCPQKGRLIARINGEVVKDQPLNRGHILIGRDKLCDVHLASPPISRHHALVVNSSIGIKILDLGSTNGTFVDGRQIKECPIQDRGVIAIGDYRIEYAAGDDGRGWFFDIERIDRFEPHHAFYGTQARTTWGGGTGKTEGDREETTEGCFIKGNINSKGDKIYHAPGAPSYAATKIDESKGERWFRSEEQARAAGWRAPKNRTSGVGRVGKLTWILND